MILTNTLLIIITIIILSNKGITRNLFRGYERVRWLQTSSRFC